MDLMKRAYKLSQKLLVKKTLNNSKSNLKNQLISASSWRNYKDWYKMFVLKILYQICKLIINRLNLIFAL